MDLLQSVEHAYRGFVPHHEYRGKLGQVNVYVMNNVRGTCMYLARTELHSNNYCLLQSTIDDYARLVPHPPSSPFRAREKVSYPGWRRFFASAYHHTPAEMTRPDPNQLFRKYLSQLQQLREGLPERFHSMLDDIIPQLPDLFTEGWPLVPNHTDLLENNIHVDKATGRITGICDWADVEVGPFGMSLGGLEVMLGTPTTSGDLWRYHPNHQELRDHFWTRFYYYLGGASSEQKRRIEAARLIGLFQENGFQQGKPATEESDDLRILGAVVLK